MTQSIRLVSDSDNSGAVILPQPLSPESDGGPTVQAQDDGVYLLVRDDLLWFCGTKEDVSGTFAEGLRKDEDDDERPASCWDIFRLKIGGQYTEVYIPPFLNGRFPDGSST